MSQSFEQLGVSRPVIGVLARRGIESPLTIQELVIPEALAGADLAAASPTGSGKTLAFGIPLMQRTAGHRGSPAALVLVPTRELARQVVSELQPLGKVLGLRVVPVYGGTSVSGQAREARGAEVVVATPGRLHDLLERGAISLANIRILVLDEADRMLDMGFRPQVDRILARVPLARQSMLFSATLDGPVTALIDAYTSGASRIRAADGEDVRLGEIAHEFHAVTLENKLAQLALQLERERELALVFVRTKHGADKVARKLAREHRVPAVVLHGNMSQNARQRSLAQFGSGSVTTLIATDVAARGLDIDAVTHVINFDPPRTEDDYVHRVGRTGRAGRSGTGLTLVLPDQRDDVGRLADKLGHGAAFAASGMRSPAAAVTRPSHRRRRPRSGVAR